VRYIIFVAGIYFYTSMRKFGLIGYPLSHSFSKGYFTKKFIDEGIVDCEYNNYPLEDISQLKNLLIQESQLEGLNVTIPYKEKVLDYLDEIDKDAAEIGAVNTIKIFRIENKPFLKGFNTDVYGFLEPLKEIMKPSHKKALILGTGGASKAVAWVLKTLKVEYTFVSRKNHGMNCINYSDVSKELIAENTLIINTSPVGMFPKIDIAPDIPYDAISSEHILYDLIYNPQEPLFLKFGKTKKATTLNGLPMLYLQAEKAWEIWNSL
jgi:shikimate dehydrogenase